MEELKTIKQQLISQVQAQMGDLRKVNAHELGAVIDMIKDLAEASYYCSIVDAMEEASEGKETKSYYYTEKYYPYYRDMDRAMGRMYYPEGGNQSGSNNNNPQGNNQYTNHYTERDYPWMMRDDREGKSPLRRKMYMESKETNSDAAKSIKELEIYVQELTSDLMEMLEKASPDEKVMLQKKLNALAAKVQNV